MIDGRTGVGGGGGVNCCCASAGVQPRPRINTPMASLEFMRTPPLSSERLPYSSLVEIWRARRPMREIVIDTEITGLDPLDGHRIVEIGAVELVDRAVTGNTF